jgi:hypothetical protein
MFREKCCILYHGRGWRQQVPLKYQHIFRWFCSEDGENRLSEMAHTYQSTQYHRYENLQSHSVPVRFSKYLNSHVGLVYCLAHFYIFF